MIIVTGGAGFIGSNLVETLNRRGMEDILVVDDLSRGIKFRNLADLKIADYIDKEAFIGEIRSGGSPFTKAAAILHMGACSDTTLWDGRYMMENNFTYSKSLMEFSENYGIPFIYASSAATYGGSRVFTESPEYEKPLNVYGYSKLLLDQLYRRRFAESRNQIVGLRYFNVYGPRESHKGAMASVAFHFNNQNKKDKRIRLFKGSDGYADGEQRRDFVYVGDAAEATLWFLDHPDISGIFNIGTGRSETFNQVADAVINHHGFGEKEYIDFPDHLKGKYQSCTQADLSRLRAAGCDMEFKSVKTGVTRYLEWLERHREFVSA